MTNLVEKFQKKQFDVVEELINSKRTMDTTVQVCSVDGTILHQEPNIRRLKKNSGADPVVEEALSKAIRYYADWFQYTEPREKLTFGFDDDEDVFCNDDFSGGNFGAQQEPAKTVLQEMKTNIMGGDGPSVATKHVVQETSSSSQMKLNFDDFNDFDNETEESKASYAGVHIFDGRRFLILTVCIHVEPSHAFDDVNTIYKVTNNQEIDN